MKPHTLCILETPRQRTVTLDGEVISGPGGAARACAEFTVPHEALMAALRQGEMKLEGGKTNEP